MELISSASADVISTAPKISTVGLNALNFLLSVAGIVAIIGIVIAGVLYLTASGDERQLRRAKKSFTYSVIGIAVTLSGLAVIRVISSFF